MEIRDFISLLWRNIRWLILGLVLGAFVGILAGQLETPVYETSTKVLVSRTRQQSTADMLPLSDEQLVAINLQLAKSQPVLAEVSDQVGGKVDADNIQVSTLPNTLIVQIKVQDTDPKRAADIANVLVQTLIRQNQSLLSGRYETFEAAINAQIDDVSTQMKSLQTEINQINDTSVQQQLDQVNQQIEQLKGVTTALEQEIAAFPLSPTPVQQALLAEKQAQLDQYRSLMTLYQQVQTNLTYIGKPGQGGTGLENPRLVALQASLDQYQQMYLTLVSNRETVRLVRMQSTQNVVQIVAAVQPKKPVRPIPLLYFFVGCLVGVAGATTVVMVFDHFDDSLKTPLQTFDQLGLRVLALVPGEARAGDLPVVRDPFSAEADAFRSLGASLELIGKKEDFCALMILNGDPRDARTSIAASLAVVAAQQGRQVVLVDGDLHHPHLHELFGIPNQRGLGEAFSGRLDLRGVSHALEAVTGLTLIPAGKPREGDPAWLDSERWARILSDLKAQSDLVIVDGPPADSADAQILAARLDAVLLAVRAGHTRALAVKTTRKRLELIEAKVTGVILNQRLRSRSIDRQILSWLKTKIRRKENAYGIHSETKDLPVSSS